MSDPVLVVRARRLQAPVGGPAAWLFLPGLALVAVAAFLATRRVSA